MESSEDDAGSATSASRGAVARESEPEQMEDVNAPPPEALPLQEASELARSCASFTMSEDNLDGVSVSSPSAQDANTSTEAILDMIDEFVDGPGAPKRLPLPLEEVLPVRAPDVLTASHSAKYSEMVPNTEQSVLEAVNTTIDQQVDCDDHAKISNVVRTAVPADSEQKLIGSCQADVVSVCAAAVITGSVTSTDQPAPETATVLKPDKPVEPNNFENHNIEQMSTACKKIEKATELPRQCDQTQEGVELQTSVDAPVEIATVDVPTNTDKNIDSLAVQTLPSTAEEDINLLTDQKSPNHSQPTVSKSVERDLQVPKIPLPMSAECKEKDTFSEDITRKQISPLDSLTATDKEVKRQEACDTKDVREELPKQTSTLPLKKQQVEASPLITNTINVSENKQTIPSSDKSGDNVHNVVVKSAQTIASIPSTKSPLKRKLVRPPRAEPVAMLTVPSQTNTHLIKSESSPQDALHCSNTNANTQEDKVPNQPSLNKLKESETNATPKKIKLIRNKANPVLSSGVNITASHQEPVQEPASVQKALTEITKPIVNSSIANCVSPIECSSKTTDKGELSSISKAEQSKNIKLDINKKPKSENVQIAEVSVDPTHELNKPKEIQSIPKSNDIFETKREDNVEQRKVPPIKLNIPAANLTVIDPINVEEKSNESHITISDSSSSSEVERQVPKLTIKLGTKTDEIKPLVPKFTIKPLRSPTETCDNSFKEIKSHIPNITKLNIKPIPKRPDKVNDVHRKSSSSEISESEGSENDDSSASVSDQTSASDHGPSDVVPKVTIKLGKPGTESEGMFYTEKQIIPNQGTEDEAVSKIKLKVPLVEEKHERVPKLTIKPVTKCESQPHSPKLTIKPLKHPDVDKEVFFEHCEATKLKITQESLSPKENVHKPKITIKPVVKTDVDIITKSSKKSLNKSDDDHIPVVTKLNIKPVLKPTVSAEISDAEVPVVSKLNIKPIIKPKDNEVNCIEDDKPRIMKLTIKPIKNTESNSSETLTSVDSSTDCESEMIPVVTKINIKPIIKPVDEDTSKDSENQSSETGNSSDDNSDSVPVVTKLNIKPVVKPVDNDALSVRCNISEDVNIPVITKLNIKPILKPEENLLLNRNLCEQKSPGSIPVVTKLNIKPILKPEEHESKLKDHLEETKNPSLVMKFNIKAIAENSTADTGSYISNSIDHALDKSLSEIIPAIPKVSIKQLVKTAISKETQSPRTKTTEPMVSPPIRDRKQEFKHKNHVNASPELKSQHQQARTPELLLAKAQISEEPEQEMASRLYKTVEIQKDNVLRTTRSVTESKVSRCNELKTDLNKDKLQRDHPVTQNLSAAGCTLLKRLLEENPIKKVEDNQDFKPAEESKIKGNDISFENNALDSVDNSQNSEEHSSDVDYNSSLNAYPTQVISSEDESKDLEKPLEINTTEKVASSGQDSPRIILKINKTDHGASSKIITEDMLKHDEVKQTSENVSLDKPLRKLTNSKNKSPVGTPISTEGKRLRSCRIVQEPSPSAKRGPGKRIAPALLKTKATETTKGTEMSVLESKRLKLGQILSNKSMSISAVADKIPDVSQEKQTDICKDQIIHNSILNDSRSKNGSSKLHKILSNLQAKQMQTVTHNDVNSADLSKMHIPELDSTTTSTGSSDVVEIVPIENSHPKVQEMIINESSTSRDFNLVNDESARDPLGEAEPSVVMREEAPPPSTPQPKKRGRPRKLPASEGAKPASAVAAVELPTPALQQRPQRSLRLSRDRPAILTKPRGRGRGGGRGAKRSIVEIEQPSPPIETSLFSEPRKLEDIDPTSSRIKLPRMTEVLDKTTSQCSTPLSSRRRSSLVGDMKTFSETAELKVVLDPIPLFDEVMKSPEGVRGGRGGRGARGGRGRPAGRSPRGRGRGRGGGRGAVYMKETMGIYGRVCGPATTTVQLFEEETCMMDDNATPAKPSHLLDEDSQSSVKSSTNDSSKHKKSKFVDLFDSNKVWTAADVKEYTWPPAVPRSEPQVMMIQEHVAMFLGVKGFKRRYPELKRRSVGGDERDYVLRMGIVTEALCDLGITAVDASEVLDIMLSDYPHKYEEYRAHQRARKTGPDRDPPPERIDRVEMKPQPPDARPEPPKIDPEKLKQELAAAAVASASEYNSRLNASRRPACVDLQSLTVHRRRAPPPPPLPPPPPPRAHVSPPAGLYPHALLPGQYQHWYRCYTPEELRYFPLNTALTAPPAVESPPASDSEYDSEWGSSSEDEESDNERSQGAKRRKLSKDFSGIFSAGSSSGLGGPEPTCRTCGHREETNRKHSNERFLACAQCHAKMHPSCLELGADTIRKCREYAWQCAECKTCCGCHLPADDDKMLFCDLCDRGFHIYCVGLSKVPSGRWHCVECAVCKSCGARSAAGHAGAAGGAGEGGGAPPLAAEWQHQSKRGPGGHKVYSHSLCAPCARAYRIGRYCPLCDRSFIGPKGTMQLVICKLCDRQLHQECVKQTVSCLNVLDYTCGECRRGGITSRAAAARLAPRTIATLFMAKRRFNKYAHRQYLQSRQLEQAAGAGAAKPEDELDADAEPEEESDPLAPDADADADVDADADADPGAEADEDTADEVVTVEDSTAGEDTAPEDEDETAAAVKSLQMDFD